MSTDKVDAYGVTAYEVNFDGLVGPTHNYGGLAIGNIAAAENALTESNPRAAALQWVSDRGCCRHKNGRQQACSGSSDFMAMIPR